MDTTRRLVPAILLLSFTPALGALAPTTVSVPVAGTVFGLPESVFFSGTALITVRPAESDAPGAAPRMVVSIDLGDLTGKGLSTGNVYVTGGLISLTRRLVPGDVIQATVPFFVRGASPTAMGRTAVASFSFDYDITTGALTSARAALAAPAPAPAN
ncbi:MAG: hypothetical protein E6J61_21330 [Deltaproteobacteria bacterium]|nr:MAG: hypothetical protein E6J61_21330 [Deltaproteobacteria bacterium]